MQTGIKLSELCRYWYKVHFQTDLVKISFTGKQIRQVQRSKWAELCPQRKLVFPFQFHFKEIWQLSLWTNFNSTIFFVQVSPCQLFHSKRNLEQSVRCPLSWELHQLNEHWCRALKLRAYSLCKSEQRILNKYNLAVFSKCKLAIHPSSHFPCSPVFTENENPSEIQPVETSAG